MTTQGRDNGKLRTSDPFMLRSGWDDRGLSSSCQAEIIAKRQASDSIFSRNRANMASTLDSQQDPLKARYPAAADAFRERIGTWLEAVPALSEFSGVRWEAQLTRPPREDQGDYALPCFALAQRLRKPPPAIATELAAKLKALVEADADFTTVEANGPYLNFRLSALACARMVIPAVCDGSFFVRPPLERGRVLVEFSQPNTHKAFHVGHLRNALLGDALTRILRYLGDDVIAANYIGDEGVHIARCLWYYQLQHDSAAPPRIPPLGEPPFTYEARGEWLGTLYSAAVDRLEQGPPPEHASQQDADRQAVHETLRRLERQEPELHALWQETRTWSLRALDEIYAWLDVHFDRVFCESEMTKPARQIVAAGLESGVLVRSRGAVGLFLDEADTDTDTKDATKSDEAGKHAAEKKADLNSSRKSERKSKPAGQQKRKPPGEKLGFFMLLKSDGNSLYATKDLALAAMKRRDYRPQISIHVVGMEQQLYFRQLFAALKRLEQAPANEDHRPITRHHLSYGLVVLPEGRMRSREGTVISFSHLRRAVTEELERDGLSEGAQRKETIRRLAGAALRYGMLKQDAARQIVFRLKDWLVAEGDTGVYLCYTYARLASIARQVEETPSPDADFSLLTHPHEKSLLRELYAFNRHVVAAGEKMAPNLLCNALYQLARVASRAYTECPVKRAPSASLRQARLTLFEVTRRVLREGLQLLGITPPERI